MHLGLDLKKFDNYTIKKQPKESALILWNHRWEHDKSPEVFFNALEFLSKKGIEFQLAVLGEEFNKELPCFSRARRQLKKHIIQFGYAKSIEKYIKWLWKADILPVTSNQDFFGGSIMEAVYCKTIPLLPRRLTYPELFQVDDNPQLFYEDASDFLEKLITAVQNVSELRKNHYQKIAEKYDWSNMAKVYDRELMKL
jgi:glycosyltransferase involved in cell wall biosynthesis